MHLSGNWNRFRKLGGHFVVADGKTNLSRPIALAQQLGLPVFVVFDADGREAASNDYKRHERDNLCILRLCGAQNLEPFPSETLWAEGLVVWPEKLSASVKQDIGLEVWDRIAQRVRAGRELSQVSAKNATLIVAVLEELRAEGISSAQLQKVAEEILSFGERCGDLSRIGQ